jgi:hypothetical protein
MRAHLLVAGVLAGCLHGSHTDTVTGAVLGRVVIYRNGVAFYERRATTQHGSLSIRVPRAAVDDFLKSLTVVDPSTHQPLAVSIPRKEQEIDGANVLTLDVATADQRDVPVLLTYVTDSPAWKPSYRAVVGPKGKIMLESWAIVDNVSSEDWKGVLVGVGASSAMSFRYDLWSVRHVDRDLLQGDDRFAVAPPEGMSPYQQGGEEVGALDDSEVKSVAGATSIENTYVHDANAIDGQIRGVIRDNKTGQPLDGVTVVATGTGLTQAESAISDEHGAYTISALPTGVYTLTFYYADTTTTQKAIHVSAGDVAQVNPRLDQGSAKGEVIAIQGSNPVIDHGSTKTGVTITDDYSRNLPTRRTFGAVIGASAGSQSDTYGTSFSGATSVENTYVVDGINSTGTGYTGSSSASTPPPAAQGDAKINAMAQKLATSTKDVVIETAPNETARAASIRDKLVDAGIAAKRIHIAAKDGVTGFHLLAVAPGQAAQVATAPKAPESDDPVGETHFIADRPMDVKAGTSAMVAMVHQETAGGVVYLYDPISERGNARFAFKAIRIDNPTDDTLEPGPMTVYGDGRFIGEGLTDAVPPRSTMVVPFAADHQIMIEQSGAESQRIAKLETVQRGVLTAEMQQRKTTHYKVKSRLDQPAKVFLRYQPEVGWTLEDPKLPKLEVGTTSLYEVDVAPKGTVDVEIAESAPMERTLELSSDSALDMMKVYLDEPDASPALKKQLETLLAAHRKAADLADKIATLREQLGEYKSRSGELHAQIVTLRAVRTTGDLMDGLHAKLLETSNKVQQLTIGIVDAEEQLMRARLDVANQLADLHLDDATLSKR